MHCGLPLGRLTFLRYSTSASLAGVSALREHHASAHGGVSTNGRSDVLLFLAACNNV